MTLNHQLTTLAKQAMWSLYQVELENEIQIQPTKKEFQGTHTLLVFPLIKFSKKSPEVTCNEIGEWLKNEASMVEDYQVVKGFLNLSLKKETWAKALLDNLSKKDLNLTPKHVKVMVEFSSPNTNKPLHLGHLRNNFLGFSVSEILKAVGYDVVKANLINDRGIHICKSMLAYQKFGNGESPESSGLKGDHFVGKYYVEFDKALKAKATEMKESGASDEEIEKKNPLMLEAQEMLRKWEANDSETVALWKKMNQWVYDGFEKSYQRMGVSFDKYYYESDTYLLGKNLVKEGLDRGIFFKKDDGSVWIDLSNEGLDQKLVMRADGTSVYITQDMGTADLKHQDFGIEKSIYVVGNEQDYHFVVLKHIMKKLERSYAEGIYHLSYGMVDLPSGKMKSREGTVVDADELMDEVVSECAKYTKESGKADDLPEQEAKQLFETLGIGALKYYLLKVDPKKRMMFNPQESIDLQGHTGPYIQYTHARIKSILRKTEIDFKHFEASAMGALSFSEKALIQLIDEYAERLTKAAHDYDPSSIANYVYELSKLFNTFYNESQILKEENEDIKKFRLALSYLTSSIIKHAMGLLGISVPERM
ncbi:MAG: arginine--tRNA ligase [Cytophagales bacterium]